MEVSQSGDHAYRNCQCPKFLLVYPWTVPPIVFMSNIIIDTLARKYVFLITLSAVTPKPWSLVMSHLRQPLCISHTCMSDGSDQAVLILLILLLLSSSCAALAFSTSSPDFLYRQKVLVIQLHTLSPLFFCLCRLSSDCFIFNRLIFRGHLSLCRLQCICRLCFSGCCISPAGGFFATFVPVPAQMLFCSQNLLKTSRGSCNHMHCIHCPCARCGCLWGASTAALTAPTSPFIITVTRPSSDRLHFCHMHISGFQCCVERFHSRNHSINFDHAYAFIFYLRRLSDWIIGFDSTAVQMHSHADLQADCVLIRSPPPGNLSPMEERTAHSEAYICRLQSCIQSIHGIPAAALIRYVKRFPFGFLLLDR